jgi:hypothetical protein
MKDWLILADDLVGSLRRFRAACRLRCRSLSHRESRTGPLSRSVSKEDKD